MARPHRIPEMLSHQALFRCLDGNELTTLAQGAHEYRIGKHEFLYQKGEAPSAVHLVISGQIKLTLPSPAGIERIVLMAGPGDTFGEEAVFPDRPSPLAAQANKDSILLLLDKQALRESMRLNRELADAVMARMGERMCELIENLETCMQRSSAQRVAYFLSQHAPEQAISFDLELNMNKSTIASHLNLAPETFSRVLSRLSKEGLIDMKGRYITLRNLHSLRSFAG